jgi:hypothetical protein
MLASTLREKKIEAASAIDVLTKKLATRDQQIEDIRTEAKFDQRNALIKDLRQQLGDLEASRRVEIAKIEERYVRTQADIRSDMESLVADVGETYQRQLNARKFAVPTANTVDLSSLAFGSTLFHVPFEPWVVCSALVSSGSSALGRLLWVLEWECGRLLSRRVEPRSATLRVGARGAPQS